MKLFAYVLWLLPYPILVALLVYFNWFPAYMGVLLGGIGLFLAHGLIFHFCTTQWNQLIPSFASPTVSGGVYRSFFPTLLFVLSAPSIILYGILCAVILQHSYMLGNSRFVGMFLSAFPVILFMSVRDILNNNLALHTEASWKNAEFQVRNCGRTICSFEDTNITTVMYNPLPVKAKEARRLIKSDQPGVDEPIRSGDSRIRYMQFPHITIEGTYRRYSLTGKQKQVGLRKELRGSYVLPVPCMSEQDIREFLEQFSDRGVDVIVQEHHHL